MTNEDKPLTPEAAAIDALLNEYLRACADHPARAISDLETELTVIAAKVAEWEPKAATEQPGYRPHGITIGLMLLRAEKLNARKARN